MSLFSNDIRVANTATPSFQQQANVGQFGWTGADQGHYNQLIQYVDECRKIYLGLESKLEYIETILGEVADIDEQVKYVTQKSNEVAEDARQTTVDVARTAVIYTQVKNMYDDFGAKYVDFNTKYDDFFIKYPDVVDAALSASVSEAGAREWYDKSKDLYDDLKEGQVYRGTWNPKTNAYPAHEGTNSVWDVILDDGVTSVDFGGFNWRSGDRLLYVVSAGAYQRLATGSGVTSVNGEVGAVTLTADKIGALGKTANAVSATKLVNSRTISGVAFDGTSNIVLGPTEVRSVPLDRKINNKLLSGDVTLSAGDVGAYTKAQGDERYIGALPDISPTDGDANLVEKGYRFYEMTGGKKNTPIGAGSGNLISLARDYSGGMTFGSQLYIDGSKMWCRGVSGGTFGDWRQLYDVVNKPTAADVGALPTENPRATGSLSVYAPNAHIRMFENDQADKAWHMEVSGGNFRLVETNVKSHIDIIAGGATILGGPTAVKSTLQVGPSATGSNLGNNTIRSQMTSLVEVIAPADTEHKGASGIVFHNASSGTAGLVYKQTDANTSHFNFISDERVWDVRVNGNKVYHEGFKPTTADVTGLDEALKNAGGAPVLSASWVQLRTSMWNGYGAADGQLLMRKDYPDAWKAIEAGKVPVVSDSDWNSFPHKRGCFTKGNGSTTFRVPDYNGRSTNSLGAMFQRGDGLNSAGVSGEIQGDAIRNIEGIIDSSGGGINRSYGIGFEVVTGAFKKINENGFDLGPIASTQMRQPGLSSISLDASLVVPTAADNHPVNVTGCWAIKLFGAVQNAGEIDAATLATQLAEAQSKISELESWPKRTWHGDITQWNKGVWSIEHKDGFLEQGGIVEIGNDRDGHELGFVINYSKVWSANLLAITDGPRGGAAEANSTLVSFNNDKLVLASGQQQALCRFFWSTKGMK